MRSRPTPILSSRAMHFTPATLRDSERVAPRLKGHLLESYVEYWQLRLKLDDADPDRVQSFLARREGGPLADRLRGEWLKSLARRGQWTLFAAEYPKRAGDDTELGCYAIQWQRIRDGDGVLDLARPLWFSGQEQPESCQPLFAALLALGKLTSQDVWTRFRQAHEAGSFRLTGRLLDLLPVGERPAQADVSRVERNPAQALAKGDFRWSSRSGRELALYALDRAARSDPGAAHDAWAKWRSRVPDPDRKYGNLLIAYNAARQLLPSANTWYREADGASQNDQQHAWRVRAALRALAWDDVARAIDAMPEAQTMDPAWRYWKARALSVAGKGDDATRLYGSLATEHHFYGFLAAEALGAAVMPVSEPLPADASALAAFGARDDVQRVITPHDARSTPRSAARMAVRRRARSTTTVCCSPPRSRAATACTTGRSTPLNALSGDTIFRFAIRRRTERKSAPPRATIRSMKHGRSASRDRRAVSSPTSCPAPARWD